MNKTKLTIDKVELLHQTGRLAEAKEGYLQLLLANAQDIDALQGLMLLLVQQEELDEALEYAEKLIDFEPDEPIFKLHLANILKAKGLFTKGAKVLMALIETHPYFAAAYNNLGGIYYAQGKLELAREAYQAAIDKQTNYADAYYNLGLTFEKLDRPIEAINTFSALLELIPKHAGGQFHLGSLLMKRENYLDAIKHLQSLAEIYPFHFETQTNLATAYLKKGNLKQAKMHYAKALEINPTDLQVLFNLGVIALQENALSEAMQYYSRVVFLSPNHLEAHQNLAFGYLTLQQRDNALVHFREALRLAPNDKSIAHTINILSGKEAVSHSPPEYIKSLFNSYADHFEAHLKQTLKYQVPQALYQAFLSKIAGPQQLSILDIGSGTGLLGELFKKHAKKLVGVDISERMLAIAAEKNIYDHLFVADIVPFLQETNDTYDLILAGDVLVYYGDLASLFTAVAKSLNPHGFFIFNTESSESDNFMLNESGRFRHKQSYVESLAMHNELKLLKVEHIILRMQAHNKVPGYLYILEK